MQTEWDKMSDADRAAFAAWRTMERAKADAKAQAEAEKAAAPKRYDDMTSDEKRAWLTKQGIPVNYGARL